jgi:mRNA-degrading endonuclease toxin of MazEF toxin-antitoxin module
MLDWSPGRDSEQSGFRPGVIVQCDEGNHAPGARTTILVPLTSQGRPYSFYVEVPSGAATGLKVDSWANCTQVFTVDKNRLRTRLGVAPPATLSVIGRALADTLDLRPAWG